MVHPVLGNDVTQLLELEPGEALSQTGLANLGVDSKRVKNTCCPPPATSSRTGRLRLDGRQRTLERGGEAGGTCSLARNCCEDTCESVSKLGAAPLVKGK